MLISLSYRALVLEKTMMKLAFFLVLGLAAVVNAIRLSRCIRLCPAILHPEDCRVSRFRLYEGILCQTCDGCIHASGSQEAGCPVVGCTGDLKRRPAQIFFIYNGTLCVDCEVEMAS